jgi:hypothetical protein
MKNLTNLAVLTVMDLLIHTNGQTTTLEIKTQLRDLGYLANQDKVHEMVEAIYDADDDYKYDRSVVNQKYNVYSFSDTFLDANPEFLSDDKKTATATVTGTPMFANTGVGVNTLTNNQSHVVPQVKDAFMTKNSTVTAPSQLSNGPAVGTPLKTKNNTGNSRDPLFIFYTENHARKSGTDADNWIVYHKAGNNEIQIFDKSLTRDQVRSRYASILKTKIQDVRSCKFSNY